MLLKVTMKGLEESRKAGVKIKSIILDGTNVLLLIIFSNFFIYSLNDIEPVSIYCSPYTRTKQTLACIMESIQENPLINVREEPQLTGMICTFSFYIGLKYFAIVFL